MFQINNLLYNYNSFCKNWRSLLLISVALQVHLVYSVAEDYSIVPADDGMSNFVQSADGSWGPILDEDEQDINNLYYPPPPIPLELLPAMKRHMGSVAALSGPRRALQQFNSIGIGNEIKPRGLFKKKGMYLPPLLRKFYLYDHENTAEIPSPNYRGNDVPELWMDNAVDKDSLRSQDTDQEGEPKTSQVFYDQPFSNLDGNTRSTYKEKRFIGSLARGGWFPRQFRGFVAEPTWEKRHLGAVARFGWVPHAKTYRERDAELKRNLASFRKIQAGSGRVGAAFPEGNPKGGQS